MDNLLKFILKSITKEDIKFDSKEDSDLITYTVRPPKEKVGVIIGKEGKMIKTISKILKIRAVVEGKKVVVNVETAA